MARMIHALPLVLLIAAASCKQPEVKLPGDDVVLAQVDASAITKYDLELSARSMFSREGADELDEAAPRWRFLSTSRLRPFLLSARAPPQSIWPRPPTRPSQLETTV